MRNTLQRFTLPIMNISGMATDGASVMIDKGDGLVKVIEVM